MQQQVHMHLKSADIYVTPKTTANWILWTQNIQSQKHSWLLMF